MKNIFLIAKNTFKQMVRDRIFYGVFGFGVIFIASSLLLGSLSLGEDLRITKDFGLAGIYIFSLVLAIFFGSQSINRELEERTYHLVILRPVSSAQFILGKFLGLLFGIGLSALVMQLLYLVVVSLQHGGLDFISFYQFIMLVFEIGVVLSLTLFFSVIGTQLFATILSILLVFIGHSLGLIKHAADRGGLLIKGIGDILYYFLPNLEKFNLRNSISYGIRPEHNLIFLALIYSAVLTIVLLSLSHWAVKKHHD